MNNLISINSKFMALKPEKLINLIIQSKHTKGIEIYVDDNNQEELEYLKNLIIEIKKCSLILQAHGNVELEIKDQVEYMKTLEEYSDYLGYPIVVTLHSIYDDKEESIRKTDKYMKELLNKIDTNKIIISLENLNSLENIKRLDKEEIEQIINNSEKLYFTYDIGHELVEKGKIIPTNNNMISKLRNVHVHTYYGKENDHLPIYENDMNLDEILNTIRNLIKNNYEENIVYEYDLYQCKGKTTEEKIKDYLKSIDFIAESI